MIDLVLCQSGLARHAPDLAALLPDGVRLSTVECFDRCEACERFVLARIDGATVKLRNADELLASLAALGEGP